MLYHCAQPSWKKIWLHNKEDICCRHELWCEPGDQGCSKALPQAYKHAKPATPAECQYSGLPYYRYFATFVLGEIRYQTQQ